MKRYNLILSVGFIAITGVLLIITSCKKDDENTDTPVPVDNAPSITFLSGAEYISSNATLEVNRTFKVGVLGSKNPSTNIDIATFKVVRTFNGATETVYENNNVGESYLSWESNELTNAAVGEEEWIFTIMDYTGEKNEISFIITTQEQGTIAPIILFTEGNDYVYDDTTLYIGSEFLVGINAFANPGTNQNIASFKINRTLNNYTTTFYEESNINSDSYTWQDTLSANTYTDEETWSFVVLDHAGRENERSFVVTTINEPYAPVFTPTYLVVNLGGIDFLDFYITCVSDDWELVKIVATYPGGLGSDVFIGSGQVITEGFPYTFSQYFTYLGGTWTFSILGIIKSGVHSGESFHAETSVVVTG